MQEAEVFVAILGCSQLTYTEAVRSQRNVYLIKACENALHYFGGTTAAIVPDNLKSAVIKSSKNELTLNESFADFADHYSMAVLPTRAYRPKDKALVEGAVKLIYRSIIRLSLKMYLHRLKRSIRIVDRLQRIAFEGESLRKKWNSKTEDT